MTVDELIYRLENYQGNEEVRIHYQIKGKADGMCVPIIEISKEEDNEVIIDIPDIEL